VIDSFGVPYGKSNPFRRRERANRHFIPDENVNRSKGFGKFPGKSPGIVASWSIL